METINEEARVDLTEIHNSIISSIPTWTIRTLKVILTLYKHHKTKKNPLIFPRGIRESQK